MRNPFGKALNEDPTQELALLLGEETAHRVFGEMDDRMGVEQADDELPIEEGTKRSGPLTDRRKALSVLLRLGLDRMKAQQVLGDWESGWGTVNIDDPALSKKVVDALIKLTEGEERPFEEAKGRGAPKHLNRRGPAGEFQVWVMVRGQVEPVISDAPTIQAAMRKAKKVAKVNGVEKVAVYDDLGNFFIHILEDVTVEGDGEAVPWDDEPLTERRPQPRYTGMAGSRWDAALKKGYIDLGLVNPAWVRGSISSGFDFTEAVWTVMRYGKGKPGILFIRDPEDVIGKTGGTPQQVADAVKKAVVSRWEEEAPYAYEREEHDLGDAISRAAAEGAKANASIKAVRGKSGAGWVVRLSPAPQQIEKKVIGKATFF